MFNRKFVVILAAFVVALMGTSFYSARYFVKDIQAHLQTEASRFATKRLQFAAKQLRLPAVEKDNARIKSVLSGLLDQSEVTCAMYFNSENSSYLTTQLDPHTQCSAQDGENVYNEIIFADESHHEELGILEIVTHAAYATDLPAKARVPFGVIAIEFLFILLFIAFYFSVSNRELAQFLVAATEKIKAGQPVYPPESLFLDSRSLEKVLVELDRKVSGRDGRGFFSVPRAEEKLRREVDPAETLANHPIAAVREMSEHITEKYEIAGDTLSEDVRMVEKTPEVETEFWLLPEIEAVVRNQEKQSPSPRFRVEKPAYGGAIRVRAKEKEFTHLLTGLLQHRSGEVLIKVVRKDFASIQVSVQGEAMSLLNVVNSADVEAIQVIKEFNIEADVVVIGQDPFQLKKFESLASIEGKSVISRLDQLQSDYAKRLKNMDAPTFVFLPEKDQKAMFAIIGGLGIQSQSIICIENEEQLYDPDFAKNAKDSRVYLFGELLN